LGQRVPHPGGPAVALGRLHGVEGRGVGQDAGGGGDEQLVDRHRRSPFATTPMRTSLVPPRIVYDGPARIDPASSRWKSDGDARSGASSTRSLTAVITSCSKRV